MPGVALTQGTNPQALPRLGVLLFLASGAALQGVAALRGGPIICPAPLPGTLRSARADYIIAREGIVAIALICI